MVVLYVGGMIGIVFFSLLSSMSSVKGPLYMLAIGIMFISGIITCHKVSNGQHKEEDLMIPLFFFGFGAYSAAVVLT